ncbi:MAG TPA: ABC transporter ATP-binding protein [Caldisericia bacterium]|nr:ABC transporter ATP-binding protein [Caldisericia bacterium]HQG82145.1 ABC transporter ATP-binding protein [Caldisericia bacterium]HXK70429.1 ABC transporter ATP-binding protein [Caldisericia bacterium]
MNNNPTIINAIELKKYYKMGKDEIAALAGVSLDIKKGDFLAILGSSGSGKTTLLNMISCLDKPSSGKLIVADNDVTDLPEKRLIEIRRKYFGFIFQQFFLIPTLTVQENVTLPIFFSGKKVSGKFIDDILERVGLLNRKKHLPSELSGGEMQRVAIARALVNNPEIIIADEPTGNLDSQNAKNIFDLFSSLNNDFEVTIICATHNLELAKRAKDIIELKDGIIKSE